VHQSQANPKANAAATISELRRGRDLKSSLRSSTYDIDLNSIASQVTKPSYPTGEFRHHALQLLKKLYLPQPDQLTEGENTIWMTYSWVNYVCDLKEPNDALDHALHTFCAIQVCVTHTGQSTKEESLSSYNVALQRLWNKLEDPKASYTDETLAAIVVLSTCEVRISKIFILWYSFTNYPSSFFFRLMTHGELMLVEYPLFYVFVDLRKSRLVSSRVYALDFV
jgi:hypothetical protein